MFYKKNFGSAIDHSFVTAVSQPLSFLFSILTGMLEKKEKGMSYIGLDMAVYCDNTYCGHILALIVQLTSWQLTKLVVKPARLPSIAKRDERLVPRSCISSVTNEGVWLTCAADELNNLLPLVETYFIERPALDPEFMENVFLSLTTNSDQTGIHVPVSKYNTLLGETVIGRQVQIEAQNGHVGQFEAFVIDSQTGEIKYLVFQRGHLWERKRETVSVTAIDYLEGESFFLNINKSEL
ncbi:MAG: hypothetical protein KDE48_02665 [Anaerolineales bacterium]|nr:hypothetical protein [Anaerolineales bacterium]